MKAGHQVVAYDVVPELADAIVADGAARGESCSDVAARSEVVITMLPDGPDVEQAVLGENGVLEGAAAGTILVDMSSISPMVSQKVAAACAARRESSFWTHRSRAANRRRSTARWPSWWAASRKCSTRSCRSCRSWVRA